MEPTDKFEIFEVIKNLKNTSSIGRDEICTRILKYCSIPLVNPLVHICNLIIEKGVFPEDLKVAAIKPLYKKGDKSDVNNYRPIALLSVFSKIFERVIYRRLYKFFEKYDILYDEQNGFRENKSTQLAIYNLLQYVMESINKKQHIAVIFMDMTKAFDLVDRTILLHKLHKVGIRGVPHKLLCSYLNNRSQYCEIKRYCHKTRQMMIYQSETKSVSLGVPQGSILGPLLFLIYINDLPFNIVHPTILFADDCSVVVRCDDERSFQRDIDNTLKNLNDWLKDNKLKMNTSKTYVMQFSRQRSIPPQLQIKINNEVIKIVKQVNFLGVVLDEKCNWKSYIDELCKKINKFMFPLRRLSKTANKESAIIAYHGYVQSLIRYAILFWGSSADWGKVFKTQKRCIRAILGLKPRDSCRPHFQKLSILTVPNIYILECIIFVREHLEKFKKHPLAGTRNLRDIHNKLIMPVPTCLSYKKSVYYMAVLLYNSLPNSFKILSKNELKQKMLSLLKKKYYYDVKEFLTDTLE